MSFIEKYEDAIQRVNTINPFASYQDMIDGQYIMECSDDEDDDEDGRVSYNSETVSNHNNEHEKCGIYDDEYVGEEPEGFGDNDDDEMSEITAPDINTISVINELFNYCKKVSKSHKKLKHKVSQMSQTIVELQHRLNMLETNETRRFAHIITESVDL